MNTLLTRIEVAFADVRHPGDTCASDRGGDEPAALVRDFKSRIERRSLDAAAFDQAPENDWLARAAELRQQ